MAKQTDRAQKAIERKTARRKEKKRAMARVETQTNHSISNFTFRQAANWPVLECLVNEDWNEPGELPPLTNVVVARQSPTGTVAATSFLVDLACLGVKNAMGRVFASRAEYERELLDRFPMPRPWRTIDLNLAAKIIRDGIAYAQELGFQPHRDYYRAAVLLEGARPDEALVPVPVGWNGKPFFVSGPHDNVKAIMAKLARKLGAGNFDFFARVSGPPIVILDDVDLEELGEEEEEDEDEEKEDDDQVGRDWILGPEPERAEQVGRQGRLIADD